MLPCWAAALVSLLLLAAAQPSQQVSPAAQQVSPAAQQLSAAAQLSASDQLSALLGPAVEGAVSRALAGQQQCGADAGQRALTELGRLEGRLNTIANGLATLQQAAVAAGWLAPADLYSGRHTPQPQPEPEPLAEFTCEEQPVPRPLSAEHQTPAVRACARSCLQLRDQGGSPRDGAYWLTGLPVPVLCDFSHDGGGWTLLLTSVSSAGWDALSVLGRRRRYPSLTDNYSILQHADAIRDLGSGDRFAYRIEAQAEKGRQRWGGVWLAPRRYSFVHQTPSQTEVTLVSKFDNWDYKDIGIEQRMPWLNPGSGEAVLTTSASTSHEWWGTLVPIKTHTYYKPSPWINNEAANSGTVLYWMRE